MKNVCVVGLGYIGLPTALMMASNGVSVVGVDYDCEVISQLKNGILTFEEDGLQELFNCAVDNGIEFSDSYTQAGVYIIAVQTPYEASSKRIDPKYFISAVTSVLDVCHEGAIIIIESTVSPGTIDKYIRPIFAQKDKKLMEDVHIAHAPERIIPGRMIYELENNPRTVGVDNLEIGQKIKELYQTFCKAEIIVTDVRTAEMTKVVENTFRDINIAFANELCKICRKENLNVYEIIRIANMHPRVDILKPGPGVGGHCISVDPWFLVGDHPELSLLIHEARKVNDSMPEFVLSRTYEIMSKHGIDDFSRIGVYGLTYKEDVDDLRESPTLQMFDKITQHLGQTPKVFDPMIKYNAVPNQYQDFDLFLNEIDIVIIMVGHSHIKQSMDKLKGKIILDTRNICNLKDAYKL